MICFEVFGVPVSKGSMKAFMNPGAKYPVVTNDNEQTKPWASVVSYAAMQYRPPKPWEGPVSLHLTFHMPKPKNLPKTRPSFHVKKPDLDKLERTIKDALKGIIYVDDSQVVYSQKVKLYGNSPSVIIRAQEMTLEEHGHLLTEGHLHVKPFRI